MKRLIVIFTIGVCFSLGFFVYLGSFGSVSETENGDCLEMTPGNYTVDYELSNINSSEEELYFSLNYEFEDRAESVEVDLNQIHGWNVTVESTTGDKENETKVTDEDTYQIGIDVNITQSADYNSSVQHIKRTYGFQRIGTQSVQIEQNDIEYCMTYELTDDAVDVGMGDSLYMKNLTKDQQDAEPQLIHTDNTLYVGIHEASIYSIDLEDSDAEIY